MHTAKQNPALELLLLCSLGAEVAAVAFVVVLTL